MRKRRRRIRRRRRRRGRRRRNRRSARRKKKRRDSEMRDVRRDGLIEAFLIAFTPLHGLLYPRGIQYQSSTADPHHIWPSLLLLSFSLSLLPHSLCSCLLATIFFSSFRPLVGSLHLHGARNTVCILRTLCKFSR